MELYFLYSGTDVILPVAFLTDLKTCAEEKENAKIFIYYKLQTEEKLLWRNITNILRGTGTLSCCILLKLL